jgi:acetyl esterase/lipase
MNTTIPLHAADHDFRVRVYAAPEPNGTALVWLHGGAFMFGSLDMPEADAVGRALAAAGTTVVSVDYTLAPLGALDVIVRDDAPGMPTREQILAEVAAAGPRAPFPVASLQTVAAFDWAVEHAAEFGAASDRVALGGASAGATLATGAALRLRDRHRQDPAAKTPNALVLAYAALHSELPQPDESLLATLEGLPAALTFPPEHTAAINANYLAGASADDPYAFPAAGELGDLPPTLLVTAERDRLRASAEAFACALIAAGVDVAFSREPSALHGFLNEPGSPAFERSIGQAARFIAV